MKTMVYDVEIANEIKDLKDGWNNKWDMKLGSAVVYCIEDDLYYFFLHEENKINLLNLLRNNICVSWSGIQFDSKVLLGDDRKIIIEKENKNTPVVNSTRKECEGAWWREYDIQAILHYKIFKKGLIKSDKLKYDCSFEEFLNNHPHPTGLSLGEICNLNFGCEKNGDGAEAPILYKNKKYDDLLAYNLQDVRLTTKVYKFIKENKYINTRYGEVD